MSKNLIASLIFGLSVFFVFVLLLPQYDGISAANALLEERRQLLTERTAAMEKVKELGRQINDRKSSIDKIAVFVPENKQVDQVLSGIEQVSQQSGLRLINITSSSVVEAPEEKFRKLFISMALEGFYPDFVSFLSNLESSLRLYDISEINLAESTGGAAPGTLNISIKLNAYYLK